MREEFISLSESGYSPNFDAPVFSAETENGELGKEAREFTLMTISKKMGRKTYSVRVFFPGIRHISYDDHDNDMRMGELAHLFLEGTWADWYHSTMKPAMDRIASIESGRIDSYINSEAKKLSDEYDRRETMYEKKRKLDVSFAETNARERAKTGLMFKKIHLAYALTKSGRKKIRGGQPVLTRLTPSQEKEFEAAVLQSWAKSVNFVGRISKRDNAVSLVEKIISNDETFKTFVSRVLIRAGNNAIDRARAFMDGTKTPDIRDSTKKRRAWRKGWTKRVRVHIEYDMKTKSGKTVNVSYDRFNNVAAIEGHRFIPLKETGSLRDSIRMKVNL